MTSETTLPAPTDEGTRVARAIRFPSAFAFVGSGSLLVLELVAGRILAPAIGVSLYTWTSIIGVVLAGISLGNWLGGRLADRRPDRRILSLLYLLGAITSSFVLAFARDLETVAAPVSWPAVAQVVWLSMLLFFLPCTVLGMTTPMLVKLSLASLSEAGRVVGRIQAAATAGSILGTFATGFFLISAFGTRAIVAGVAVVLLALALLSAPGSWRRPAAGATALLVAFMIAIARQPCTVESNYSCIRVLTDDDDPSVRVLQLDYLVHGYVDIDEPDRLIYDYEKIYVEVVGTLYPGAEAVDSFHIGGGTYTFPRYLERTHGGRVVVAEIDPAVTDVARTHLGLSPDARIDIRDDDARRVLLRMRRDETYDLVVADAFNDLSVPFHLTTREFDDLVRAHLRPDGVYLVNVVDGIRYDFLGAYLRTLRATFSNVRLLIAKGQWPLDGRRKTFVVVASDGPIPVTPSMRPQEEVDAFLRARDAVLLTDDHVPVDQLLAPVFRQRLERRP